MRIATLAVTGVAAAVIGCSPATKAPTSWAYTPAHSQYMETLPPELKAELLRLRADMQLQRNSQYYSVHGDFTPDMIRRIDAVDRACTQAYLASDRVIMGNLTPNMSGLAKTGEEADIQSAVIVNTDMRSLSDDWRSFWLMDKPAGPTEVPVVDSTGR